ncbi:MAG: FRG domain-containing protein [Bryobacterales bacterium]|nr:FRG domain-containing protein [Bryobacterales bacterium]
MSSRANGTVSHFREVRIETWKDFRDQLETDEFRSWAFRGTADASWPMYSSLSRYLMAYGVHRDVWSRQEQRIVRIFRRKSHLFLESPPAEDDTFEWLALMQHHGAPTRLLDFTWSPYVAAFFALERTRTDAAVWAICPPRLSEQSIQISEDGQPVELERIGPRTVGNYERYFLPNTHPVVVIGEPQRMNQRLIAQSGTFVMPGVLDVSVEQIVAEQGGENAIVKFTLTSNSLRTAAMRDLYQMNITNATLFPDLDGLARSLAYELEFHWAYDPLSNRPFPSFRE